MSCLQGKKAGVQEDRLKQAPGIQEQHDGYHIDIYDSEGAFKCALLLFFPVQRQAVPGKPGR